MQRGLGVLAAGPGSGEGARVLLALTSFARMMGA